MHAGSLAHARCPERMHARSPSWCNEGQAHEVVRLLGRVRAAWGTHRVSVGIITPYKGQEQLLKRMVVSGKPRSMDVEIRTVDGGWARIRTPSAAHTEWLGLE